MKRRSVLQGAGAGALLSLWPGWLREAFAGQAPCGVLRGTATLAAAVQRAHRGLRPLLVLVIPKAVDARWDSGRHLGELLNHGGDRALAAMGSCEVVCASMGAVRQLFPSAPAGEPAVLLASVERSPASITPVIEAFPAHEEVKLEPLPGDGELEAELDRPTRWEQFRAAEDVVVERCIARSSQAVEQALLGDAAALTRRGNLARERLPAAGLEQARALIEGAPAPAPTAVLSLSPLLVEAAVRTGGAAGDRLIQLLAEAARAVLCGRRIPGSAWAQSGGCGVDVEPDPDAKEDEEGLESMVACGMGHVPRKSSRMLYLFSRKPWHLYTDQGTGEE
jgi:hypothetical protein